MINMLIGSSKTNSKHALGYPKDHASEVFTYPRYAHYSFSFLDVNFSESFANILN